MDEGWPMVEHTRATKALRVSGESRESTTLMSENSFHAIEVVKSEGFENDEFTPLAIDSPGRQ